MSRERFRRMEAIFDGALEIADIHAREQYVDESCLHDPDLAAEVRKLIRSHESWTASLNIAAPAPQRCGPYQCGELLGTGGMGSVYRGRRADGEYRQEVAIKFLRGGLRTPAYLNRFRTERQILANLNHPHIARLLDGGVASDGEPYLVMEFVDGESIDAHCDSRKLSIQSRIALFRQVLDAVDYAHRNLIVHQDLKPSNILVNREGAVKLVDFGTSRLLADDATLTGLAPLTPAYASPEQLRGEPPATTNDVFSLGVVLFVLLTGAKPFGESKSYTAGLDRALRDTDPARPETALTEEAAAARSSTVPHLRQNLKGDLAAILRKAMAHDAAQRYPSVAAFSDDLERYTQQRPVLARRHDLRYIAGRAVRRHWRAATVAAIVVAGLGTAAMVSVRASRIAQREAERALAANRFLTGVFEIPVRDRATRSGLTVRELLDLAQQRVPPLLGDDPAVAADVDAVLANGYFWLGESEKSRELLDRGLSRARQSGDVPRQAAILARLSAVSYQRNQFDTAWSEARQSLALWEANRTRFAPAQAVDMLHDAATTMLYIRPYDAAHRPYLQTALDITRGNPRNVPDSSRAAVLQKLGESYINVDRRYAEALPLLAEAVEISRRDVSRGDLFLQSLQSFGRVNRFLGDFSADERAQREAYELSRRAYGETSASTVSQRSIWSLSLLGAGQLEDAYRESSAALADMRRIMPVPGSPLLWTSVSSAAMASCLSRRFAECEALAHEGVRTLGPQPSSTDLRLTDAEALLGIALAGQGRHKDAAPYLERSRKRNQELKRTPLYAAALR